MDDWEKLLPTDESVQGMFLQNDENARLMYTFEETHKILSKLNINYFLAFGSLIGALRHGRRMPWDDDIDIVISADDFPKLAAGLEKYEPSAFDAKRGYEKWLIPGTEESVPGQKNNNKHTEDGSWPGDLTLWKKNWGVTLRTYIKYSTFPFVDIFTYTIKDGKVTIPKGQLANAPVKSFSERVEEIFPLRKADFEGLVVPVPNNSAEMLKRQYGEDVFTSCKIIYNHKQKKMKVKPGYGKKTLEERVILEIPIEEFQSFNAPNNRWKNVHKNIHCDELY